MDKDRELAEIISQQENEKEDEQSSDNNSNHSDEDEDYLKAIANSIKDTSSQIIDNR